MPPESWVIFAVRRLLSGIAVAAWGEFDAGADIGDWSAITTTAVTAAARSMPQLMIRARRRSCDLWVADRGRAGVARGGPEPALRRLLPSEDVSPMVQRTRQLKVRQDVPDW